MRRCAVATCNSNSNKNRGGIKFFPFPENDILANKWYAACKIEERIDLSKYFVCSKHFEESSIVIPMMYRLLGHPCPNRFKSLNPTAVPTLQLPDESSCSPEDIMEIKPTVKLEISIEENIMVPSYIEERHIKKEVGTSPIKRKPKSILEEQFELAQAENEKLKIKVDSLSRQMKQLEDNLAKIFTRSQIKKLLAGSKRRVVWGSEDIESAVALLKVSRTGYDYLLSKNYPFPSSSTVRNWASKSR